MEGSVLANNHKMLQLMKSLNFQINNDPEDTSVKYVVAQLHVMNI
jgi:hypothetical protein